MKLANFVTKTYVSCTLLLCLSLVGCGGDSSGDNDTNSSTGLNLTYPISDTEQITCYDNSVAIDCPESGDYFGQDAQINGNAQSYTDNGDGTVTDNVTGIIWSQTPDILDGGDGIIDSNDKLSSDNALTYCENLELGSYTDWTLPNVKQLYSLMNFLGTDPTSDDTSTLTPFIDNTVFGFAYGSTVGERIIDSQYATTSKYVNDEGTEMMFGVNFADGRIKGYTEAFFNGDKTYFVMCMRGNTDYAVNNFTDNTDNTITDNATGLMWAQKDSGADYAEGFDYQNSLDFVQSDDNDFDALVDGAELNGAMSWQDALDYTQQMNEANYLGYNDWRLPNIKELHSILDYSRTPQEGASIDIDYFDITTIQNENGVDDYAFYWSGTTHATDGEAYGYTNYGDAGAYVAFGRALGYNSETELWEDVHGAGAQRSDPKAWDGSDYTYGDGPQADAVRLYNYVRLVRDAE